MHATVAGSMAAWRQMGSSARASAAEHVCCRRLGSGTVLANDSLPNLPLPSPDRLVPSDTDAKLHAALRTLGDSSVKGPRVASAPRQTPRQGCPHQSPGAAFPTFCRNTRLKAQQFRGSKPAAGAAMGDGTRRQACPSNSRHSVAHRQAATGLPRGLRLPPSGTRPWLAIRLARG